MEVDLYRLHLKSGSSPAFFLEDEKNNRDSLAVEEPLEIRLGDRAISITMRSPGFDPSSDEELACGFLFTEGLLRDPDAIMDIRHCGPVTTLGQANSNTLKITLSPAALQATDLKKLERHFYTSSSCGVCGKKSIEALHQQSPYLIADPLQGPFVSAALLAQLPERLLAAQQVFQQTGGLHASALFSNSGKLLCLREDVGRHNALDKVIGWAFRRNLLPLSEHLLLVSGRASFELVQKASMAGLRIMAAIGAPSSLAVQLAEAQKMTLIGFLRTDRMNIYTGKNRLTE